MNGSRGADKMDVLALVRAEECQPVASNDFLDLLWRTAKDELALVVGCAASAGIPSRVTSPSSPARICRSTLRSISHLHLVHHACKNQLAVSPLEWFGEIPPPSHCPFLRNGVFFAVAPPSLAFRPTGWLGDTSTRLPAWRAGT